MSGPYDASAFCRIQELYERAAVITHSQWDRDAGSRQHFNHNTNEPTQISEQEQVHVNGLGVSAAGFLNLIRSHFDSDAVQDGTILRAFSDIAGDDPMVKEDVFHIILDHLRDDYIDLFQRQNSPYARSSSRSPTRISRAPSLTRLHSAQSDESAESSPSGIARTFSPPAVSVARSASLESFDLRDHLFYADADSPLRSARSLRHDIHSRTWHGFSEHRLDDRKADQKADTVAAKPASIRTSNTCEERAPIDASVLAAWQMFYCGGSAPGVHAQKCSHNPGKSQAARESAQSCYVV